MTMAITRATPSVDDLLPQARAWAAELGERPSKRATMTRYSIGAPKAQALLDALDDEMRRARSVSGPPAPDPMDIDDLTDPEGTSGSPWDRSWPAAESETYPQVIRVDEAPPARVHKPIRTWPLALIGLAAFVAVWGGWVGLGRLAGFGVVNFLPGIIPDGSWSTLDTAITLPIGVEAYAAYALRVLLHPGLSRRVRRMAGWSAASALALGMGGQIAYHLLASAHLPAAPWWVTTLVSCLPVATLGLAASLAHLVRAES